MAGKVASPKDPAGLFGWMKGFAIAGAAIQGLFALMFAAVWAATGQVLFMSEATFAEDDPWFLVELLTGLVALISIIPSVIFAILFLRLNFRLTKNLKLWEEEEMRSGPVMAVLWYFIPFANLILPPRIAAQMWRATFPDARLVSGGPPSIAPWWIALLVSVASGYAADRFAMGADAPMVGGLTLLSMVAFLAALLLLLRVFGPMATEHSARVRAGAAAG